MRRLLILVLLVVFQLKHFSLALTDDEIAAFQSRDHPEQNTGVQGWVEVAEDPNNDEVLVLKSNGIPDHDTGTFPSSGNPNSIAEQAYKFRVPKNPSLSLTTTCLPMGPAGMAINGVAMYNPFTIICCDAGETELDLFDMCNGHPSPSYSYHYHINPKCNYDLQCGVPSSILGVALDGFPIYGPNDEFGVQLTAADLDECNGRTDTSGNYKYHVINEYPYFMGCYRGAVRWDVGVNIQPDCACSVPVEVCTEVGPPRPPTNRLLKRSVKLISCNQKSNITKEENSGNSAPQILVPFSKIFVALSSFVVLIMSQI